MVTKPQYDWWKQIDRLREKPDLWLLVAPNALPYVVKRMMRTHPALKGQPLDMHVINQQPGRGGKADVYMRYTGPRRVTPARPRSGRIFRTFNIPVEERKRQQMIEELSGVPLSDRIEKALRAIIRRGHRMGEPDRVTTIGASVDQRLWYRAMAKSEVEGFSLNAAIREELRWVRAPYETDWQRERRERGAGIPAPRESL